MSKELVIGSNRHETKVAILEDDQLAEIYFQRANEYSLAGSIHKGRVTRVLPGMQSAFVDLGLERDTFLYVSDFFEENEDIDTFTDERPVPSGDRRDRGSRQSSSRAAAPEPPTRITEETVSAVATEIQPAVTGEVLQTADNTEQQQSAPQTIDRQRPDHQGPERQTGDRSFRGDRRGRRSRRRRPRAGGFPENKYAQPMAHSAAAPTQSVEAEQHEVAEPEAPRDVIILPGESLAKYRNLTPALDTESDTVAEEPDISESEEHEETTADHEDIAEEASAIELADKVFSHGPESPLEEEQKLAEVRQDQPAEATVLSSPFIVTDIEEQESGFSEPVPFVHESSHLAELHSPEQVNDPLSKTGESHYDVLGTVTAETELLDEEDIHQEADVEPFDPEDLIDVEEEGSEPAEEFVALLEEDHSPAATPTLEAEAPQAQTATVRESGGRYMHRVSRRMRRRRGGNRPNQQESAVESRSVSVGGAAAGLQPEPRQDIEERSVERADRPMPSITELLKPGQEIIVQIAKEPLGQKGARITSHIALPGRYVVFMPSVNHVGVSRKIASDEERQRLKRILQTHRVGATGGFIVRTAGEGVPEEEIAADMDFLYRLWMDIRQKAEKRPAPALLHYDLDVVQRILRDQVTEEFKSIWVDSEDMYENVLSFMQRFQPALVSRVKMYTRSAPIFDAFGITQELEKALRPKVWLKSGGYIVINQTEALVAIDINTGKYVGKSNRLEDTIVKTNTEAVKEIVRQIRLRDLGGIIVVDFIDMDERKNRQKVMQTLEEAMRADRAPYKILQFNDFGLVAITRKRVKQSLERTLCSPCPYCEGAGYVKSVQTVIGEILVESQKLAKAIEGKDVLLRVHPEVAKVLKANDNHFLEEIEETLGKPVMVKGDPSLHLEKFDLG